MRLRGLWLLAALMSAATIASAQTPPKKKKKPKKPKTEQPADPPPDESEPPPPPPPEDKPPAKIDTDLKESDPSTPGGATNPWLVSGVAKRREGGGAPVPESTNKDEHGKDEHSEKKKPIDTTGSKPLSVTAQAGYGSNNLRIGFGARVGYEFLQSIYIGAAFVYHLGTSVGPLTLSAFYPAVELGYDWHYENITLRPYSGLGMLFFHVSGSDSPVSNDATSFFTLYPGIQVDYQIPDSPAFVGVDLRGLLIFGNNGNGDSIGAFAVGGARF